MGHSGAVMKKHTHVRIYDENVDRLKTFAKQNSLPQGTAANVILRNYFDSQPDTSKKKPATKRRGK